MRLLFRSRPSAASRWFVKVQEGRIGPREERRFLRWLGIRRDNADHYAQRELVWHLLGELEKHDSFVELQHVMHTPRHKARTKWWRLAMFSARAARRFGRRMHARMRRGGRRGR